MLVSTYQWKNLSMDFVTGLPLSADWKGNSYDLILKNAILLVYRISILGTINAYRKRRIWIY